MELNIPVITLLAVFVLIAVRRIGDIRLRIWQIMTGGAIVVLLTGQIPALEALRAINIDVMLFLFGVFVVGEAMAESGYIHHLSSRLFKAGKRVDHLVLLVLFGMGTLSALMMNDTLAIIGTPLMIHLARRHKVSAKPLLLSLAFAVTIGSVMSPLGNPQNLLIAITADVPDPFITFFKYLAIPTFINLFIAYLVIKVFYKDQFTDRRLEHRREPLKDPKLAFLSKVSLILLVSLIVLKMFTSVLLPGLDFRLTYIALVAALPIVLLSPRRVEVLKKVDWATLAFFASMFILMASVWRTGLIQSMIGGSDMDPTSIPAILGLSVLLSQLISNVPFVALYTPLLVTGGADMNGIMALAAGSTIAGNLTILGAASNVIIIQNAEKEGETLTFIEFIKVGLPLTIINVLVYLAYLSVMAGLP
jgi:Na+/H+ antiporter NhaD/arsenite permease-like protein